MVELGFLEAKKDPQDTIEIEGFEPPWRWKLFFGRLFHGEIVGPENMFERWKGGINAARPMEIVRSGAFLPDIFCPSERAWMVSDSVRDAIGPFKGVGYKPVVYRKLVDLPFPTEPRREYLEPSILDTLPHEPRFETEASRHVEWFLPEFNTFFPEIRTLRHKEPTGLVGFPEYRDFITRKYVSAKLLDEYPLIDSYGGLIMRKETLDLFKPFIDWRFFDFVEFTVNR